ncbi:MAG: DNA-3-methyladenine glycosylase I [Thermoleophilia bacterium]
MSPTAPGWKPAKPASLAGYLEALSRPVFSTGMTWRVIEAKWDGIRDAFAGFDPERVAAMTDADVDRLLEDPRIIRNRKKVEATVVNAERMLELDSEHGSFGSWLGSFGSFDETVAALRREFRFLGDMGAYLFLWTVEQPVPSHEEWAKTHGRVTA